MAYSGLTWRKRLNCWRGVDCIPESEEFQRGRSDGRLKMGAGDLYDMINDTLRSRLHSEDTHYWCYKTGGLISAVQTEWNGIIFIDDQGWPLRFFGVSKCEVRGESVPL